MTSSERLAEIQARHTPRKFQIGSKTHGGPPEFGEFCRDCDRPFPCDTVDLLAALSAAEARVETLQRQVDAVPDNEVFSSPGGISYLLNLVKINPAAVPPDGVAAFADEIHALRRQIEDFRREARSVMNSLAEYGPSIVPHLMDDDDNAGERLRQLIAGGSS